MQASGLGVLLLIVAAAVLAVLWCKLPNDDKPTDWIDPL